MAADPNEIMTRALAQRPPTGALFSGCDPAALLMDDARLDEGTTKLLGTPICTVSLC